MMKIGKITVAGSAFILAFSFFLTTSFCQQKDKDTCLEAGKRLYNEGRFEEALKQFVAALGSDPTNEEITRNIDKTQMKIKELMEISRALVRDDKIPAYGREIKVGEIKPLYYDQELKKLAEDMTRLIEKTKGKAGKITRADILRKKKAEERLVKVKEYFEKGQRLYDRGKTKKATILWEKALAIAKEDPGTAQFVDELKARIESQTQPEAGKEEAAGREEEARQRAEREKKDREREEIERLGREREERERLEREEKERLEREREERQRLAREKEEAAGREEEARQRVERERKDREREEIERLARERRAEREHLKRERSDQVKKKALRGKRLAIIIAAAFLMLVSALILIKSKKKAKPPEVKKEEEKIFEQAKSGEGIFRARRLRDIMKKKRKDLFEKGDDNK